MDIIRKELFSVNTESSFHINKCDDKYIVTYYKVCDLYKLFDNDNLFSLNPKIFDKLYFSIHDTENIDINKLINRINENDIQICDIRCYIPYNDENKNINIGFQFNSMNITIRNKEKYKVYHDVNITLDISSFSKFELKYNKRYCKTNIIVNSCNFKTIDIMNNYNDDN